MSLFRLHQSQIRGLKIDIINLIKMQSKNYIKTALNVYHVLITKNKSPRKKPEQSNPRASALLVAGKERDRSSSATRFNNTGS